MIKIGEKNTENEITFIKDYGDYNGNYSIVLQNTLTKEIHTYVSNDDIGNTLYHKFSVDLTQLDSGEYYMVLLENPQNVEINTNPNNPKKASGQVTSYIYVTLNGDYITNADFFIVNGSTKVERELKPVCTELMRVGEYKSPKTQYNSTKQYIQYGK